MNQTMQTLQSLIDGCEYKDWNILLKFDGDRPYLQVSFQDADAVTGDSEEQWCRKWMLSYWMKDVEVVRTAHMAIQAAVLHEADELFKFRNRTIFNPHRSVHALWDISTKENVDVR